MAKSRTPPRPTMLLELVPSAHGTREPSLRVNLGAGASSRQLRAALHFVAAHVEMLSEKESWCVQTKPHEQYDHLGRVYLELGTGDDEETERGMTLLRQLLPLGESGGYLAASDVK